MPEPEKATAPAAREAGRQNGTVVLDEANDLLVISEAGALLPSAGDGWADALAAGPSTLSKATASWAQKILASEAESAGNEALEPAPRSEECIEEPGGDDAFLRTVDWVDW
ncbi:MAG: hypothetical protein QNJ30_18205 [Kiloniellales bacterium]|nr:hypothetical protein [Kiloniellales bacterium]